MHVLLLQMQHWRKHIAGAPSKCVSTPVQKQIGARCAEPLTCEGDVTACAGVPCWTGCDIHRHERFGEIDSIRVQCHSATLWSLIVAAVTRCQGPWSCLPHCHFSCSVLSHRQQHHIWCTRAKGAPAVPIHFHATLRPEA